MKRWVRLSAEMKTVAAAQKSQSKSSDFHRGKELSWQLATAANQVLLVLLPLNG